MIRLMTITLITLFLAAPVVHAKDLTFQKFQCLVGKTLVWKQVIVPDGGQAQESEQTIKETHVKKHKDGSCEVTFEMATAKVAGTDVNKMMQDAMQSAQSMPGVDKAMLQKHMQQAQEQLQNNKTVVFYDEDGGVVSGKGDASGPLQNFSAGVGHEALLVHLKKKAIKPGDTFKFDSSDVPQKERKDAEVEGSMTYKKWDSKRKLALITIQVEGDVAGSSKQASTVTGESWYDPKIGKNISSDMVVKSKGSDGKSTTTRVKMELTNAKDVR